MIPDAARFTVREIAGLFRIKDETVRRWIRRGELAAIRNPGNRAGYHVLHDDLARFVDQQFHPGTWAGSLHRAQRKKHTRPDSNQLALEQFPGLVYVANTSFWNRQIVANGGGLRYAEPDSSWLDCVHPDDRIAAEDAIDGGALEIEYRLLHPGGAEVWVCDCAVPAADGRWYGTLRDVTDHHQQELEDQRESEAIDLIERALAGTNVVRNGIAMVSAIPGVSKAETIRTGEVTPAPNVLDVAIPGKPEAWGVLRLHTLSPQALDDAKPFLDQVAAAIGISMLNAHTHQRPVRWYSTRDIAHLLKVQEETVRRWIRRDEIQITNLGSARAGYRIHPVDLEAFISERYRRPDAFT